METSAFDFLLDCLHKYSNVLAIFAKVVALPAQSRKSSEIRTVMRQIPMHVDRS